MVLTVGMVGELGRLKGIATGVVAVELVMGVAVVPRVVVVVVVAAGVGILAVTIVLKFSSVNSFAAKLGL
jgi:hypothetical protein